MLAKSTAITQPTARHRYSQFPSDGRTSGITVIAGSLR
ncbi:hypothetical protein BF49_7124 [Bradyrhizobium sp.]|nr:hypothetical protein BF49_3652 [Bradyrhizobium sp.]CUT16044.1 hypothetical protein BF49_7124 [Bradyrhizobium sp.]